MGGFVLNDLQVVALGEEGVAFLDLEHFAFAHFAGDTGENTECLGLKGRDNEVEGMSEEVVGHEYGDVVAPARVDGGSSAAEGGFVNDVVVEESGGVDEFDSGGDADGVGIGFRMLSWAGLVEDFGAE